MNKLGILVLTVILISGLSGCTGKGGQKESKANVGYYRTLLFSETPFDIEKGTHKLAAGEEKDVNSYKLTRDNSGRLLSVEFLRGDSLLDYASMGGAAKIVYEYKDNKQIKTWYNKKNERIESAGVYTGEYTLNDKGIRTGLKFFGKDGQPVENRNKINYYVWSVLPDSMVKELRYNLKDEETVMNPFCPFYELRFSYSNKGYVTRMANFKADTLYNCTAENCGDIGVSYFTFTTNDAGDLENQSVYNVKGQMSNLYWGWSKRISKYNQNGYPVETSYLDQDNEYVGGKNVPVYQTDYDAHGAVTEVRNMDKERKLINNPETGVAITDYKYDAVGNRIETLTYDKDRVPVKVK
ncbi:MAG: hypothetical protein ABR974_07325 [Bacteroidales bacterium]|jgi:hypothetical protein